MSRADKRYRVLHEEKNLRLFAFNNFVNGYRPKHGLEEPAIVLRTRIKKDDEHPALQWQPLAQQIQSRKPMTHSTFVLDGTRLEATTEQDEITHRGVEGPMLKRINNLLVKLAPRNAQLIGAGSTAEIVAKTAICCSHTLKKAIGKVILVCPNFAEVQRSVEGAEKRLEQQGKTVNLGEDGQPAVEAVVVLDSANAPLAPQWEKLLSKSFRVTIFNIPSGASLFSSIASCVVPEQREEAPTEGSRSEELRCYVITFRLSPYTKQAEQDVEMSPVTENPNLPPPPEEDEDEEDGEGNTNADNQGEIEEAPIPSHESRYVLADLFNVKNATVRFEGNIVDGRTLANVHGLIELDELVPELNAVEAGTTVVLSAQLSRDEDGRTRLNASTVTNVMTGLPASYFACGSNFPAFNYSAIKQYYGAALIRGRKIVLCRSLEGIWRGMRFPHRPHCEPYYTPFESAIAAISDQVDVSSDNFYFNPAIAPVTYYPPNEKGACVTLFIAIATNVSDGGVEDDSKELLEQLHDPYDWYSFRTASAKLPTRAERDALVDVRRNVQRAFEAGLYTPLAGHGVFGDDIPSTSSYAYEDKAVPTTEPLASASSDVPEGKAVDAETQQQGEAAAAPNGIQLSDLLVLQDPFEPSSLEEVSSISRLAPSRVKAWNSTRGDADWAGVVGGPGCIVLPPSHDIDVFAQQELPPVLPEDCPPTVRVVIAASSRSIEEAFISGNSASASSSLTKSPAARLMACLEYADALMCRDGGSEFSPLVVSLMHAVRPDIRLITERDLSLLARGEELPHTNNDFSSFPPLLVVPFAAKLPFHPEKLNKLLSSTSDSAAGVGEEWGCDKLLWIGGSGWLSTCPLHKVGLTVAQKGALDTKKRSAIEVVKANPWWCCVEEGDRPEGLDTSDWDPLHGSRRQEISVVMLADPTRHDEVSRKVLSALEGALCSANDYRHWHRLADPFKMQE